MVVVERIWRIIIVENAHWIRVTKSFWTFSVTKCMKNVQISRCKFDFFTEKDGLHSNFSLEFIEKGLISHMCCVFLFMNASSWIFPYFSSKWRNFTHFRGTVHMCYFINCIENISVPVNDYPDILQFAAVNVISTEDCQDDWDFMNDLYICTRDDSGQQGPCFVSTFQLRPCYETFLWAVNPHPGHSKYVTGLK